MTTDRDLASKRRRTWVVLVLGVLASVAANIAAGQWSVGGVLVSAIAPVMFLGTLSLVTHVIKPDGRLGWTLWIAAALVALMAFVISYRHQVAVALRFGQDPLSAYLLPFVVDVSIAIATTCLVVLARPQTAPVPELAPVPAPALTAVPDPVPDPALVPVPAARVTDDALVEQARSLPGPVTVAKVKAHLKVGTDRARRIIDQLGTPETEGA